METKEKINRGITLIALVITIIVLLILAGVAIAALNHTKLFEKTKDAKKMYENSAEEENKTLLDYEEKILAVVNNRESDIKLKECKIEIKNYELKVSNIDKIVSFSVVKNGKVVDTVKGNTCELHFEDTGRFDIYVIAIDEDANVYKSNIVEYEYNRKMLYLYGNKCEKTTGGWLLTKDINSLSDVDSANEIILNSPNTGFRGSSISTKNSIDLTNFNKLKMVISKQDTGTIHGFRYGIKSSIISETTFNAFSDTDITKTLITETGDNFITEIDIKDVKGSYYIGAEIETAVVKIFEIWLE